MAKTITREIKMGDDQTTMVSGKNIDEVLAKIVDFHTMGEFERDHFAKKGTLIKELRSGWYVKSTK